MSEEKKEERFIKISIVELEDGRTGIVINKENISYMEELGLYKHATSIALRATLAPESAQHEDHCPHSRSEEGTKH